MQKLEILEDVGLTKNESKIYLALLKEKEVLAGSIAKKTTVHRKNVYDVLESLLRKGLVNMSERNNKKYWKAQSPAKIKESLQEKQRNFQEMLPSLLSDFSKKEEGKKIIYFEGENGLKSFLQDIIKSKKELLMFLGTRDGDSQVQGLMSKSFEKLNEGKIKTKILFNYNSSNKNKIVSEIKKVEYKILPKNFSSATQLLIYEDKTGILITSPIPLCILIDNKEITKEFKNYFNLMWRSSKNE